MEELGLTHKERGYRAERTYDGYYPSLHLTYNTCREPHRSAPPTPRPTAGPTSPHHPQRHGRRGGSRRRQAGNPAVVQGNITVPTPACARGPRTTTISRSNTTRRRAASSASGVFSKEHPNFFGNVVRTRDPRRHRGARPRSALRRLARQHQDQRRRCKRLGRRVQRPHSLARLGAVGAATSGFANGTKLELDGSSKDADFNAFTPESLNWGFSIQPPLPHRHGEVELPRQTPPRRAARPRARRLRVPRPLLKRRRERRISAPQRTVALSERLGMFSTPPSSHSPLRFRHTRLCQTLSHRSQRRRASRMGLKGRF
jgi:hypothetical protein